jgi:predicted  nucleic acid-binding Zn-ribbon protein
MYRAMDNKEQLFTKAQLDKAVAEAVTEAVAEANAKANEEKEEMVKALAKAGIEKEELTKNLAKAEEEKVAAVKAKEKEIRYEIYQEMIAYRRRKIPCRKYYALPYDGSGRQ